MMSFQNLVFVVFLHVVCVTSSLIPYLPHNEEEFQNIIFKTPIKYYESYIEFKNDYMDLYRLPDTTEPLAYNIKLNPYLREQDSFKMEANVAITIRAKSATREIILHCVDLYIKSISINGSNDVNSWSYNENNQVVIIELEKELEKGFVYLLSIVYTSVISDSAFGFYRSSYVENKKLKYVGSTQFEPTHARKAFPCYDEPSFRAPFIVSIARYHYQSVLSNMPLSKTSKPDASIDNKVWDTFEETPKMPTYLLAFIVSEFQNKAVTNKIKIWTRKDVLKETKYVSKPAEMLLKTFENIFQYPYDLPKMDLVAVPKFYYGAMENWGLVVFREQLLLFNEEIHNEVRKDEIVQTVAHEYAHQWFGNLVTLQWWDYIWLNEGFATFFQYYATDVVFPEWQMWNLFVVQMLQPALMADENWVYRPMTTSVRTPNEIAKVFDIISYSKAASILRMVEYLVGKDLFLKIIVRYLKKGIQNGGTVTPNDLWSEFQKSSEKFENSLYLNSSVSETMKSWTDQRGYPLVTVRRYYDEGIAKVTQEVYGSVGRETIPNDRIWSIPITYVTPKKPMESAWLVDKKGITLDTLKSSDWLLVNYNSRGYYRVNYDNRNWELLTQQLYSDHEAIDVLNRAQILDDAFSLAFDNIIDIRIPLKIAKYLKAERDMTPWLCAFKWFDRILKPFIGSEEGKRIRSEFIEEMVEEVYKYVGLEDRAEDTHMIRIARPIIIRYACGVNHGKCENDAVYLMDKFMKNHLKGKYAENPPTAIIIPPEVKYEVFCAAIRRDGLEVSQFLWKYYEEMTIQSEKEIVLHSLACVPEKGLISKYIDELFQNEEIIEVNKKKGIKSLCTRRNGLVRVAEYLSNKFELRSPVDKSLFEAIISQLGLTASNEQEMNVLNKLSKLLSSDPGIFKVIKKVIDEAQQNVNMYKMVHKPIEDAIIDLRK